jgi:Ni/Fe-hydrogenase 1 B-type cytochrome subunit
MSTVATAIDPAPARAEDIVPVYVWEVPVRLSHWLIVLSIALLSVTGLYIGHPVMTVPGAAARSFVMGWAKVIHFTTAWVFMTAVTMRIVWMFTGNRYASWNKFIPTHASRRRGIWPTVKFYLFALRKPPGFVGHNPVAGLAYLGVFGLYALVILTGLILHGPSAGVDSPLHVFGSWAPLFGGLQATRWIHHITMWLLLGFAVHHVYSSVLMSIVEANATVESIFSGYKFVPREDLQYSGYRFINRKGQVDE